MKLFHSTGLLAALSTLALRVDAWTITSSPAAAPSPALGAHEDLAKTWTVAGAASLSDITVQSIGRVFVDYDPSLAHAAATIVVSGNSSTLLDAIEVLNGDNHDGAVKIHLTNQDLETRGYLLTRIYVSDKQSLQSLRLASSGDVVIGDDVLSQGKVDLSIGGSGDLYAGSASAMLSLDSLTLSVGGSGDVRVQAKSLDVKDTLTINVSGSGDVSVIADSVAVQNTLASTNQGSGDVVVQSGSLVTHTLSSTVRGSGGITYANKGSCTQQTVVVRGSGGVKTGSIVCVDTTISLSGSGNVLVQTTGKLEAWCSSSGDIRYWGAIPSSITTNGGGKPRRHARQVVKPAKTNKYHTHHAAPLPAHVPTFVLVKTTASAYSTEPRVRYEMEFTTQDAKQLQQLVNRQHFFGSWSQSLAARTVEKMPPVEIAAALGVAVVVAGIVVHQYKQRRARQQYEPVV